MAVVHRYQMPVLLMDERLPDGSPVVLYPTVMVVDPRFEKGVIEVDKQEDDDAYYARAGLWVEHMAAPEVDEAPVREILDRHRRREA
jgi:hypothetical protein